jgi:hypothetical protein
MQHATHRGKPSISLAVASVRLHSIKLIRLDKVGLSPQPCAFAATIYNKEGSMMHRTHCVLKRQTSEGEKPLPARKLRPGSLMRAATAVIGLALLAPASAIAHDELTNDDTDNIYRGYVGKQGSNRVVPWVRTLYFEGLKCVRFQMEAQHTDLEMVVISPNPSKRYRNNDGAAPNLCGATCPIVRIEETEGFPGYYTVHVSPRDGTAIEGEFLLRVTVKPTPDAICSPATPVF